MKNNKCLIIFCLSVILLNSCNVFQKVPEYRDVKKSTGDMIRILEKANNLENNQSLFSGSFHDGKGIKQLIIKNISTAIIILIITFFAGGAAYFISERISFQVYGKIGEREREEKLKLEPYDPDIPGRLALSGRYSEAILYMYRTSLNDISRSGFQYSKGMTNIMIWNGIKKDELRPAFKKIFTIAERILFDSYEAVKEDYAFCKNEFEFMREIKI